MTQVLYDYTRADASGASCVAHAWAKVPVPLTRQRRDELKTTIARELKARDAVMVAHYYVDGDLQDLAQETGGCVADSLEMARFGRDHAAQTLVVAGRALHGRDRQDPVAGQARADARSRRHLLARPGLPAGRLRRVLRRAPRSPGGRLRQHQRGGEGARRLDGHQLVRAGHRARTCTRQGEKILWAPDQHLGRYIQQTTGADMLLWNGACIVHDEFKGARARAAAQGPPGRDGAGASRVARGRGASGRRGGLDLAAAEGGGRRQGDRVHRRHRQRHPAPHAAAGARQDAASRRPPPATAPPARAARTARGWR